MKGGFTRPFIGMAAAVLAQFEGVRVNTGIPAGKKNLIKSVTLGIGGNNTSRHKRNAPKECARRVRQMQAGTATPNYVHGEQYPRYEPMFSPRFYDGLQLSVRGSDIDKHWKGKF
jgi:hypothetical protein